MTYQLCVLSAIRAPIYECQLNTRSLSLSLHVITHTITSLLTTFQPWLITFDKKGRSYYARFEFLPGVAVMNISLHKAHVG